jgi:transcriptional regulator GlxA family with amidase domain
LASAECDIFIANSAMTDFTIAVLDGVLPSSLSVTLDILGAANRFARLAGVRQARWRVLAAGGHVALGQGLAVTAAALTPRSRLGRSVLVIPGLQLLPEGAGCTGLQLEELMAERMAAADVQWLARLAATHRARGGAIAASCSSTLVLGEAGLLDGRHATTHWRLTDLVRARYPACRLDSRRMVVEDDGVVTAGAAMAQIDLMLLLVTRSQGPTIAQQVMRYLLLDERPSQAAYAASAQLSGHDGVVGGLERLIEQHLPRRLSLQALADLLHMSTRTLERRVVAATGQSPRAFAQAVRMRRARHLLETTPLSVAEVAERVGYCDPTGLHRLAKSLMRQAPGQLRR